jgi:carbon-monoxide dehydrogenase medium subunit
MIPEAFDYQRAASAEEAVAMLRDTDGEAQLLAGGHSLIPLMKLRLSAPSTLIDIGRVPGLSGISEANGEIAIGATTTYSELEASPLLQERAPIVSEAAGEVGDAQVRHRGTIGGGLAHADPASDLPAVIVALDGEIVVLGPGGERSVRAEQFFQGLFEVDLAGDELITAIRFAPVWAAAYAKLSQRASRYAIVGVAASLEVEGGNCLAARVAVTGASTHAQRLPAVEDALTGAELSEERIAAAAERAADDLEDVNADIHASEEYRRAMAKVFARRAIAAAAERA